MRSAVRQDRFSRSDPKEAMMTTRRQTQLLEQGNRGLIALLSLGGMLLDGAQGADLLLQIAVILWLWAPELRRIELLVLRRLAMQPAGNNGATKCQHSGYERETAAL
jgi:hypothetical protein